MTELRSTLTKAAEQVIQVSTMQNRFEGYMFLLIRPPPPSIWTLNFKYKGFLINSMNLIHSQSINSLISQPIS